MEGDWRPAAYRGLSEAGRTFDPALALIEALTPEMSSSDSASEACSRDPSAFRRACGGGMSIATPQAPSPCSVAGGSYPRAAEPGACESRPQPSLKPYSGTPSSLP